MSIYETLLLATAPAVLAGVAGFLVGYLCAKVTR